METDDAVHVTFDDGSEGDFALVFGADGVHSGVRRLVFGDESQFARFLGGYVAAFHLDEPRFEIGRALKLYEETDRVAAFYPLDESAWTPPTCSATTRSTCRPRERLAFVRKAYEGAGWIAETMLKAYQG